jgi:hypothetical protein
MYSQEKTVPSLLCSATVRRLDEDDYASCEGTEKPERANQALPRST